MSAAAADTAGARTVTGIADSYKPSGIGIGEMLLVPSLTLAGRVEAVDAFPVDADGNVLDTPTGIDLLVRFGLSFNAVHALAPVYVIADFEMDAVTGFVSDGPTLEGEGYHGSGGDDTALLRKASLTLSYGGNLFLRGGVMTSHWGLGLIANDGAHGWRPGSAEFNDPRGGDRVLRGMLTYKSSGEDWFAINAAVDSVIDDDVLRDGDDAYQGILALLINQGDTKAGLYGVYRRQEATDGDSLDAYVVDAYLETSARLSRSATLTFATEWALVTGKTSLAPSTDFPEHDILQLGGVVRAGVDAGSYGGVLDLVYASGDRNFDDESQNAFKADPNFSSGFILYRQVVAGQTGRAPVTASNLELVGEPAEDLDRFPSRGSISNTVAIAPRAWIRPVHGLELYGGPVFAFAEVDVADPFNSRLGGGTARNALDRSPGKYLGTELDLGLRYTTLFHGSELSVGVEGGVLLPGSALRGTGDALDDTIVGGRALLQYRL